MSTYHSFAFLAEAEAEAEAGESVIAANMFNAIQGWSTGTCLIKQLN